MAHGAGQKGARHRAHVIVPRVVLEVVVVLGEHAAIGCGIKASQIQPSRKYASICASVSGWNSSAMKRSTISLNAATSSGFSSIGGYSQ